MARLARLETRMPRGLTAVEGDLDELVTSRKKDRGARAKGIGYLGRLSCIRLLVFRVCKVIGHVAVDRHEKQGFLGLVVSNYR